MWSKCIHSWGTRTCLLSFDSIVSIVLMLQNERWTLSKIIFKTKYLANLLWIVWYDYMKICEWFLGVGYDVYHSVVYFLLTWIVRNNMMLLNYMIKSMLVNTYMLIDWDVVGKYIYVNFIVNVVGDCIYVKWWWIVGEYIYAKWLVMMWWIVCVNICIESSHMFMHTWLMVTDVYIQNVGRMWNLTYDVFVASKVTTLRWFGTACI